MSALILKQFGVKRGPCPVLQNISFELAAGEFVGLVGPNGAGKTTLMRGMQGLLPHTGFASLSQMNPRQRALHAAWMPQEREVAWPILVEDVLRLGRAPHRSAKAVDQAAVDAAIEQFALQSMRTRPADQLSGGEQARVLLARAVVQQTPLLLADEPIAGLDPANQIDAMEHLASLADNGKTVVASLHDLGLAARYCSRILVLFRGEIVADGSPAEALTDEIMHDVFGVRAYRASVDNTPIFVPWNRV